jgi:hypothetical protein
MITHEDISDKLEENVQNRLNGSSVHVTAITTARGAKFFGDMMASALSSERMCNAVEAGTLLVFAVRNGYGVFGVGVELNEDGTVYRTLGAFGALNTHNRVTVAIDESLEEVLLDISVHA